MKCQLSFEDLEVSGIIVIYIVDIKGNNLLVSLLLLIASHAKYLKRKHNQTRQFCTDYLVTTTHFILIRYDLHKIVKNMAAMGNFEKPILHGLCSYGVSAKAIVGAFCKGDGDKLK